MTGVNVLNTIITQKPPIILPILISVMAVLSFIGCIAVIVLMAKTRVESIDVVVAGMLLILSIFLAFAAQSTLAIKSTVRYEVTIDNNVSLVEFNSNYNIIEQRGNIYVVEEKTE